jgi:hypothetical protein
LCAPLTASYTYDVGRKVRRVIILASTAVALLASLNACSMLGVTVMDRLNSFMAALNGSRTGIELNFDPAVQAAVAAFDWTGTGSFPLPGPTDFPYALNVQSYSDPSNVTGSVIGPGAFNLAQSGPPTAAAFTMVRIGMDWFIEGATIGTIVIP